MLCVPDGMHCRRNGRVVMHRTANPLTSVRFRLAPPSMQDNAGIAQLVERNLAKVEVASSRLVSRSRFRKREAVPKAPLPFFTSAPATCGHGQKAVLRWRQHGMPAERFPEAPAQALCLFAIEKLPRPVLPGRIGEWYVC